MVAVAPVQVPCSKSVFPLAEVQARLRNEFEDAVEESVVLHPGWQPVLDSLRMVMVIAAVEDLFDFKLPPEKVVKKGGCKNVDEGVEDMTNKIREIWKTHQK